MVTIVRLSSKQLPSTCKLKSRDFATSFQRDKGHILAQKLVGEALAKLIVPLGGVKCELLRQDSIMQFLRVASHNPYS